MSEDALVENVETALANALLGHELLAFNGTQRVCSCDRKWRGESSVADHLARAMLPIVEDYAKAERKAGAVDALQLHLAHWRCRER